MATIIAVVQRKPCCRRRRKQRPRIRVCPRREHWKKHYVSHGQGVCAHCFCGRPSLHGRAVVAGIALIPELPSPHPKTRQTHQRPRSDLKNSQRHPRPSEFGSPWRSPSPRAGKATAERRTVRQDVWFNPTRTAPRLSDLGPVLYLPPLPTNSACFAPRIRKYFSLTHIRHSFSPQHGSRPSSALGLHQFVRPLGNIGLC